MGRIFAALLVLLLALPARVQAWDVIESVDAFTDKKTVRACARDEQGGLHCSWIITTSPNEAALWHMFKLPDNEFSGLDPNHHPWMRVDGNPVHDDSLIAIARQVRMPELIPRVVHASYTAWQSTVKSGPEPSRWHCNKKSLLNQLLTGSKLLVRVMLIGGLQRDSALDLSGFAAALRKSTGERIDADGCNGDYSPGPPVKTK